jgi:cytochrome P450
MTCILLSSKVQHMKDEVRFSCDPVDPAFFNDPYPVYDEMRALGPCFLWEQYGHYCFPGFHDVDVILRDRRFGRQISHLMPADDSERETRCPVLARFDRNSLLEMEPPNHTRLRRLVNRAFVSRQAARQRQRIGELANALIDDFEADSEFDLLNCYAEVIPVTVICEMLGVGTQHAHQLLSWSHKMVAIYEHGNDQQVEAEAENAASAFESFIRGEIERKRSNPCDDLLTDLVIVEEQGERLSNEELIATCMLLLNAGHEATVHAIGNGVKTMLEQAVDVNHWMSSEEGTRTLVEESLRFDPPLYMFSRYVLEDMHYQGRDFKQGEVVGLLLGAANRDAVKFADPHHFDLQRGGIGQVSFGAGIHFCVGAPLARLEVEIAIRCLFARLPGVRLAAKPEYADRYHFHGLERLELAL